VVTPLAVFLSIWLYFGLGPAFITRDPYPSRLGAMDLCFDLFLQATQFSAALMLWRLKQSALYLFVVAFLLGVLNDWWHVLIRDIFGSLQGTGPYGTAVVIFSLVAGTAISISICIYVWRLRERRVLVE